MLAALSFIQGGSVHSAIKLHFKNKLTSLPPIASQLVVHDKSLGLRYPVDS